MKIAISGSSGFVGTHLKNFLQERGDTVIPLTRSDFDAELPDSLQRKLAGCDAVINLAGSPINVRWTKQNKELILNSRVEVTRKLVEAINRMEQKPAVFISTSAVGYYPSNGVQTEQSESDPNAFLAFVTRRWEAQAAEVSPDVRLVILRFAVVLGKEGGMLPVLLKSFSKRVGVMFGNGKQTFAWIHIDDLMQIFALMLRDRSLSGVFNCVAPGVTDFEALTAEIGFYYKPFIRIQLPPFILKLVFLEGASFILQGQHAVPQRLSALGFRFKYPTLSEAMQAIFK